MASIMSKLARAAFATRASPSAVGGGGRPAAAIRSSPAGGPNSEKVERARSKSESPHASCIDPNPPVDENVLKSKEAMWAFYEHWCKCHGISRDHHEMTRRLKIFSDNARRVYEVNSAGTDSKLAMTRFADMTKEEKSVRLGKGKGKGYVKKMI